MTDDGRCVCGRTFATFRGRDRHVERTRHHEFRPGNDPSRCGANRPGGLGWVWCEKPKDHPYHPVT